MSDETGITEDTPITLGGRAILNPADRLRRYAGLAWSGGEPEVWAFPYYDSIPTNSDSIITPIDVVCAAALHPGLSRSDLEFFMRHRNDLAVWLDRVPADLPLWQANDELMAQLDSLSEFDANVSLTLLTKVLHRKRPMCIPLLDRHVIDWYRQPGDPRRAHEAWPLVTRRIRADLQNTETMAHLTAHGRLVETSDDGVSPIRFIDIAIWMEDR